MHAFYVRYRQSLLSGVGAVNMRLAICWKKDPEFRSTCVAVDDAVQRAEAHQTQK